MIETLIWSLLLLFIGFTFTPVTTLLTKQLYLRGLFLSQLVGTLAITFSSWFVVSLGLAPYSLPTLLIVMVGWLGVNAVALHKQPEIVEWITNNFKLITAVQLLLLLPFLLFTLMRSYNPSIDNFEKFMDMNFVSAILMTRSFPPQDPWFAGEPINYYYFGHLVYATLIKLTGVAPEVGYNLAMASIFTFAVGAAFTIGASLAWHWRRSHSLAVRTGVLTALIVNTAGTLYTFSYLFKDQLEHFWFWSSIRLIPYAIHEFPAYTFAVSDLHAHLLNVPHVLLVLNFLLVLVLSIQQKLNRQIWLTTAILGVLLSIVFMTSAWDFPMYGGLIGITVLIISWWQSRKLAQTFIRAVLIGSLMIVSFALGAFFFITNFDSSIAGGIGFVTAHTSLKHFAILWGPQLLVAVGAFYWSWRQRAHLTVSVVVGLLLFAWVVVLLMVPEVIYLKDIYGDLNHRLNTILKFYYQAFIVSGVAASFFIMLVFAEWKTWLAKVWKAGVVILFVPILVFPFQIVPDYYDDFANDPSLDGMQFFQWQMQDDRRAIEWLRENVREQVVVVEASGDSYTHDNRISTFTGLPTIQGWFVHEWLWRGGAEKPGQRADDVSILYQGTSDQMQMVIEKYDVEYIVVGNTERTKYPALQLTNLQQLTTPVFQEGTISILQVKPELNTSANNY